MNEPVIETEVNEGWDMEDTHGEVDATTKDDDALHIISLPEEKDKQGVYIDVQSQIVAKHLNHKDLEAKAKTSDQSGRLKKHALETIDNLGFLPKAVIYQLGARQVRVSIKDSYPAINQAKLNKIMKYAPDFAKSAFSAAPEIKIKTNKIPNRAIKEIQEWLEMGRSILRSNGVSEPEQIISFVKKYQPKTTTNALRAKEDYLVQSALNDDLPLGTMITAAKTKTKG